MASSAQRIADLEDQVALLAAEVRDLRAEAFIIKALEEVRAGVSVRHSAVLPRRPRYLRVVDGGA